MHKNGRKFIIWVVMTLFLVSLWPAAALGADNQTSISLDQAIRIVKQNFTVPAAYSNFSSGFNSSASRQSWSLNWNDPSGQGGNFSAEVNAITGEVISMNCWKPSENLRTAIPAISVSEARDTANRFLKKIIPQRFDSLRPLPENQVIPLIGYNPTYTLRWERIVNNIPVAGDGATVEVNLSSKEITGYSLNWTNLNVPSPAGAISNEKAIEVFTKNEMLKLQYIIPPTRRPLSETDKQQPVLVYSIADRSNGIIDAFKGTPLKTEPGQWLQNSLSFYDAKGGMGMGGDSSQKVSSLTPEEENEISRTANLISKEAAAAAAEKYILIPSDMKLQTADLGKDWQNPESRIWTLQWNSPSAGTSPSKGLFARINAITGELINFYLDIPTTADQKPTLSRDAALNIAEDFIKKVYPQRFDQIKLKEDPNSNNNEARTVWDFNYERVVNGISCASNGIDINVNRINNRVTSFNLNWNYQDFPAAANVLRLDKANQLFLQGLPLTLTYMPVNGSQGPVEIKLVYQPQNTSGQPQGIMINATTGDWLDAEGKPVSKQIQGYNFNDITGHFAEEEIALLGQAGIFGEYGTAFHPNENITLISLLRAMLAIHDGGYYPSEQSDQEIMNRAKTLGWLQKEYSPSATVD
ncbi:MAG TPA: YcdB/YcdC domain-containing protein, partial [Syntrophomonadaceae bacterium]|nr:YcdB/YcdC domain-containing protein [Syntrophomonadaceae bacterium]